MRPTVRWIIAVLMALVFLGLSAAVFYMGFFLGGMMTDSCSGNLQIATTYLMIIWPLVMLVASIAPSVLVVRKARWYWVLLSAGIGLVASGLAYLVYIPLLMAVC
jgi:hypothetical protein